MENQKDLDTATGKSVSKRLSRPLLIVIAAAIVVALVTLFFPKAAATTVSSPSPNLVQITYDSSAGELKVAANEALSSLNDIRKNAVESDPELIGEFNQLVSLADQYSKAENLESWVGYDKSDQENKQAVEDMKAVTQQSIADLKKRVGTWVETVDAEMNSTVPEETADERIERLQTLVGQPFKYRIGECRSAAEDEYILGCYTPGDDFYTITSSGLDSDDCILRETIVHEHRHYEQWVEGLTSEWSNDQLEADARAYEYLSGC